MNMHASIVAEPCNAKAAPKILEQHLHAAAMFQAKNELRLRAKGLDQDADRQHNRLVDTLESSRQPHCQLESLVQRLGRHRSLDLMIDRDVIDLAIARYSHA